MKEKIRVQEQKERTSILRSENTRWIVRALLSKKTVKEFKSQVRPLHIWRAIARKGTEQVNGGVTQCSFENQCMYEASLLLELGKAT